MLGFGVLGHKNIPRISVGAIPSDGSLALSRLARRVARALVVYPYFTVLSGFDKAGNPAELKRLARALGVRAGTAPDQKLSFTRVNVDPSAVARIKGSTAYSRTHLPLAPHTDSSYLPEPHQLVAFQCVVVDRDGGSNMMVPVDHVLGHLTAEDQEALRQPAYPFSRGHFPVLSDGRSGTDIRYYRQQIDQAAADGGLLDPAAQAVLNRLDDLLTSEACGLSFKLSEGEAVLFNNHRVLHGRSGFDQHSHRTLFRVRYHVDLARAAGFRNPLSHWFDRRAEEPVSPVLAGQDTADDETQGAPGPGGRSASSRMTLARRLVSLGRFDEALPHVAAASAAAPQDFDLLRLLAGLQYQCGDWSAMQATMGAMAVRFPIMQEGRHRAAQPTVLRTRGMKGAKYRLVPRAGGYSARFEGGHFSVRDLLDSAAVNQSVLHLFDSAPSWPADQPKPDVLLNTIACADRMPQSLAALADFCRTHPDIPVINHPDKVLQTTREGNARRLNQIDGVLFPATERIRWDGQAVDPVRAAVSAMGGRYPLIIRPVETHTGVGVALVDSWSALDAYLGAAEPGRDYYLIQYHDISGPDGLYRKSRTFCIDGRFYPVASLAHTDWNVHSGDRYSVMDQSETLQAQEISYLSDFEDWLGPDNVSRLQAVRDRVGLEFFGIDFTKLPDGRLVLFELNAAMRHNFDHAGAFPYTAPHLRTISSAFQTMVEARTGIARTQWLSLSARAGQ